jgi:simple sugar transport system ATP-binding protein
MIEVIAGLAAPERGALSLDGISLNGLSTQARFARGMAFVPEDRQLHGLVMEASIKENILLGRQYEARFCQRGLWLEHEAIQRYTTELIERFAIMPPLPSQPIRALSGGNQQKVLVAREASREASFFLIAHPTRGVDIGAIEILHQSILALREAGASILLISSELPELLALSDRILVLYNGRSMGICDAQATNEAELGRLMLGVAPSPLLAKGERQG